MVPRDQLVEWLNGIQWKEPRAITPAAASLIEEHLHLVRKAIAAVIAKKGFDVVGAHGFLQTAGHDTQLGNALLDELFERVTFKGAGVRTSFIATIAAAYCWELDLELAGLANPWLPIMDLYGMGYTISGEDSADGNGVTLSIGFQGGTQEFKII